MLDYACASFSQEFRILSNKLLDTVTNLYLMAEHQETDQPSDELSMYRETGKASWENVRGAYIFDRDTGEVSEEVLELIGMFFIGTFVGGLYGGVPAMKHARNRYIQTSDAALYPSKLEAVGTSYNAGARGFIRYGYRWGWRTGCLAVGFHGISSFLAVYRDKTDIFNYIAASVCTGAMYRFDMGVRGIIGGALVGSLLGIPAGCLLLGMQKLSGDTILERNKKARMERMLEKRQELAEKQQVFGSLIEQLHNSVNSETKADQPDR